MGNSRSGPPAPPTSGNEDSTKIEVVRHPRATGETSDNLPHPEYCSRQTPLHKDEQLIDSNQAFIDHTIRKGLPAIREEFLRDFKESPGLNEATRYCDFYDASEVEIPGIEPKFIVGSAPTLETESRESFWKMVYESNVSHIFYLDNRPDCSEDPFIPWTANDSKDYGKMHVTNKRATTSSRDSHAVLEVLPEGQSDYITVIIAQSVAWPAELAPAPEPRKSALHFTRLLKDVTGRVLVICKTGLANSCAFVMCHSLIEQLNAKELKDPVDVLLKLRADRWGAIQNEMQYFAIYLTLIDYIQVKTTQVKNCDGLKRALYEYAANKKPE